MLAASRMAATVFSWRGLTRRTVQGWVGGGVAGWVGGAACCGGSGWLMVGVRVCVLVCARSLADGGYVVMVSRFAVVLRAL